MSCRITRNILLVLSLKYFRQDCQPFNENESDNTFFGDGRKFLQLAQKQMAGLM
jgi:hypothetical protein